MSPVHDQSYRHYDGARQPLGRAWLVILGQGLRALLRRRALVALVVLAWVPFLVRTVQIYVVAAYPQAQAVLSVTPRTFQRFVELQSVFAFFVTVYAGSGLIANDRRANALQVYLSKPLLRVEYIIGKLAILLVILLATTLAPALLLVVVQALVSGSVDFLQQHTFIVPAVTLASLLRVLVAALTMLALSSMSKSARYVAVMYTGVIFFTQAMYAVLTAITGSTRVAWISITANLDVVSDAVFRQPPRYETPVLVSVLVLAGLVVLSISVLDRQVRGVEVVS
ncbi:MAG TPA: ABC transporter permease subunit [Vicinamibacterales bacterium]|nr:ABC transporter permease subunit [Vicinamibacterales bacterium]